MTSNSSDDELEREQKRKARARNKKVKKNYALDFISSINANYFLDLKDKFDTRDHEELDDETEFDIEHGIAVEKNKKSKIIRIHDGTSFSSKNIGNRDDRSDCSSDSLIPPSETGDTTTRAKVRFLTSKHLGFVYQRYFFLHRNLHAPKRIRVTINRYKRAKLINTLIFMVWLIPSQLVHCHNVKAKPTMTGVA